MNLDFTGKVAIVTGGAMGIGEATARTLAGLGASVAILDVDGDGRAEECCRDRKEWSYLRVLSLQYKCRQRSVASHRCRS